MSTYINKDAYQQALSLRDLTDAAQGPHAMQLLVANAINSLSSQWSCKTIIYRHPIVVKIEENYDKLHYPTGAVTREERYTRYIDSEHLLRTHTTALIPAILKTISGVPYEDVLIACPGLTYRRDVIDKLHTGEPHQMDLWRIYKGKLEVSNLLEMIGLVVESLLPGAKYRVNQTSHPYTTSGLEIEAYYKGVWIEIGECGLALPALLDESGLSSHEYSGLAMGIGLDRLLMLRKQMDDIRLLRSSNPKIANQMLNLEEYKPVSKLPAIKRDLSIALTQLLDAEEIGDKVRVALGSNSEVIESVEIVSKTPVSQLPEVAQARLGATSNQINLLIRVTLRPYDRTLVDAEANEVRNLIYKALHEGEIVDLC